MVRVVRSQSHASWVWYTLSRMKRLRSANPSLAQQWHPSRNGDLTPGDVSIGSNKKFWWFCEEGHEWQATVNNRYHGTGCPYCNGKRRDKDNCLQAVNPKLAKQWHPSRNAPLTPKDVGPGSRKKVWWLCSKGHEWQATINSRNDGRGCPYCSGKAVNVDNCLETVNPALSRQWHPTKNEPLTPSRVTAGSDKKVWWICTKSHEWQETIANRSQGTGCPYCSGRRVNDDNCLQNVNPVLAAERHLTNNKPLTPANVTANSRRFVWWRCTKGHEWKAKIATRNKQGTGCPCCSGRTTCKENCLQTVSPALASEWHPTRNGTLTPSDVTPGSHKRVWWQCRRGHEWQALVTNRRRGDGCPCCSGRRKN